MTVRILLADDHQILRQGLRSLLEREADFEVVGEAGNGRTAVRMARDLRPDVVVMDVAMPDLNGIEAARQIVGENSCTRILALSMHSDTRFVSRMLKAGATGYLLKDCAFEEISGAVRKVVSGQSYLGPAVAALVVEEYVKRSLEAEPSRNSILTPREREVLQFLSEGRTTREMAEELHISVKTVETHRKQMMDKLGLHSVAELTKFAVREGITNLES